MNSSSKITQLLGVLVIALICVVSSPAQVTTGNLHGTVIDPNGAAVPSAKVTLTNKATNTASTTQTSDEGRFTFNGLLPETYTLTVEAPNFKTLTINDVRVQLKDAQDIAAQLEVGGASEQVVVTAGASELIDTTTTTLSKGFSSRQVSELAQTGLGAAGVNNLALIAPNVSSSGGVGVGTGGSVGGQRPRNNNFMVDGVDNNDKSVTGPQSYISPEEVAEFTLLQNQFSAEFGRSNGGQFITVTKSGGNDFHGSFYGGMRNRKLNALDTLLKNTGVVREDVPGKVRQFRSDYVRAGANFSGPLHLPRFGEGGPSIHSGKDKLFFFASYERLHTGDAASAGGITTPTAAGFAVINSIPGLSATNLGVFNSFVPAASTNDAGTIDVLGRAVPIGNISFPVPTFTKQNHVVTNIDWNQSAATQHRWRFSLTNFAGLDPTNAAVLPFFNATTPNKQRLFSYTLLHNLTSNLINETRLAYRRSEQSFPVRGDLVFPGLDQFPNIGLLDLAVEIGPNGNFPQSGIENNYQVVNNLTYLTGNHSFKFGGDFRNIISPQRFIQRERGDYQYLTTAQFLRDLAPDALGERNVGGNTYYGNQRILYGFVQDDWRVRSNLTLNLGLGYSYQEVPLGAKFQAVNNLASVPGLIAFTAPKAQTKNFAPKVGFAYSPDFNEGLLGRLFGSGGKTSIRAGFSMGYDYIFDNLYILSNPPQAQQTIDTDLSANTPNFLANGGISPIPQAGLTDPATARAATGSHIPDQEVPYSLTWTGSIQRQFGNDYSLELRYLGTRGIHLLTQNRINIRNKIGHGLSSLPTFFAAPTQAQIDATALDLADIQARSNFVPAYEAAGFSAQPLVDFLSNGNSTYHGASAALNKRLSNGLQLTAAYTWSHLIDDTTAEVFSTVLSPRRVEDFQDLRPERADSALDRRHRFVLSSLYDLPWFKNERGFAGAILGGWNFAGTLTFESGQKATVRSGNDSNQNGDSAGDRAIRNPNGVRNTASAVTAQLRTCTAFNPDGTCAQSSASRTIGYLVNNPNAEYIQAGNGALSNSARNTL
ncbi:MAG TPA: carboxypeptidase regulatory-like domain-containing protein, partial [Pyrinomonadaceae bacterium]|nr:carboxypeptidase regulatory-like domain-containing protein [Pyrinomonadaceae bacterium]